MILFPKNIKEEINKITKLYKPFDKVLNLKNTDPFKNGEACKKAFISKEVWNMNFIRIIMQEII